MSATAFPDSDSIGKTRWFRLIPVAILVYIISFMDRTNISFAFSGIEKAFHVGKAQAGLAGGIFFIGYLFMQIPGGYLAEHWSAKKFVGIMILIWGVFAAASGIVHTYSQLLIVRFLLGVAEGGIWPAILVLISHWFPAKERARAYAFWIMNIAIASIITAPLSGWILTFASWRALFIIEGIFPFVIAAPIWWLMVYDYPHKAKWVTPEEQNYIETTIAAEQAELPPASSFRDVIKNTNVWKLAAVYFFIQIGFYGLALWLPTLVKELSKQGFGIVGLLVAIPYLFAMVGLWLNGAWSDKDRKYSLHVFGSLILGAITLVLSIYIGTSAALLALVLVSFAMAGSLSYDGPFWTVASTVLPVSMAGMAMGLINAIGNLGGFVGPYLGGYLQQQARGSFLTTALVLGVGLICAGLIMLSIRKKTISSNVSASASAG